MMKDQRRSRCVTQCIGILRRVPRWGWLTIVFAILAFFIGIAQFPAVNVYYSVSFDRNLREQTEVSFLFDKNSKFPEASCQHATVTEDTVLLRLDPENNDSKELRIKVFAEDIRILEFKEQVNVGGHLWYTVSTVNGSDVGLETSGKGSDDEAWSTFLLDEGQMHSLHMAARSRSEVKYAALLLLLLLYVLLILRFTILKAVDAIIFASGTGVLIILGFFLYRVCCKPGLEAGAFPYRLVIIGIMLVCLALVATNVAVTMSHGRRGKAIMCIVDYFAVAGYTVMQYPVYTKYLQGFPDETAHLSYIAFLKANGEFVPQFSEMEIYQPGDGELSFSNTVEFNYLGHPPLYYSLMGALGDIKITSDGAVYNLNNLRLLSFCIGLVGLGIIFFLGYTRLPKIPLIHLLFAVIVVTPPNLIYGMCGLSNDTLALVTVSIFAWGIIRFMEERYSLSTYVLIAVGISGTMLTKVTAGLLVGLTGLGVVLYTLCKEKRREAILCPRFFVTLPVYGIAVAYYALLYAKYRTLQPSYQQLAWSEYVTTAHYVSIDKRQLMSVFDYINYYIEHFISSWYGIAGHVAVPRDESTWFSISCVGVVALLFIPLSVFFVKKDKTGWYLAIGLGAVSFVMAYQALSAFWGFYNNGYPGGFQSRYYLCAMELFAFAIVWLLLRNRTLTVERTSSDIGQGSSIDTLEKKPTQVGILVISCFILLLIYDGFISSFIYWADMMPSFQS